MSFINNLLPFSIPYEGFLTAFEKEEIIVPTFAATLHTKIKLDQISVDNKILVIDALNLFIGVSDRLGGQQKGFIHPNNIYSVTEAVLSTLNQIIPEGWTLIFIFKRFMDPVQFGFTFQTIFSQQARFHVAAFYAVDESGAPTDLSLDDYAVIQIAGCTNVYFLSNDRFKFDLQEMIAVHLIPIQYNSIKIAIPFQIPKLATIGKRRMKFSLD